MPTPRARAEAIRKAKAQRLLQTIERYDRHGHKTSALGSWYQIIPIPTAHDLEPVAFRLWVRGHAQEEYTSLEAARKGMRDRIRRDNMKPIEKENDDPTPIPF